MNSLYNSRTWTDGDGITWKLEDMSPGHRANLLAMLRRRADRLLLAEAHACFTYDGGEMAQLDFMRAGEEMLEMDAQEWLEEMPLVRRLLDLDRVPA